MAKSCAKFLAGCIVFCDSDSCAKLFADAWLNPARSSQSKFQETIVPRVLRVPFVPPRYQQSAKPIGRRFAALEPSGAAGWAVKVLHGTHGVRRKMPPEFAEAVEMVRCGEISGREAAQLCGMSYSTFRERMRESKAHTDRDLSLK